MHVLEKIPVNPFRVIRFITGALRHLPAAGLALAISTTAQAALIVAEGFSYAGQADNTPLGTAFNGGTGLGGSWSGNGRYRSTGLAFSDLAVAGGCVQSSGSDLFYRPLNVSKTGTIWGSFLFQSVSTVDASTTLLSYIVSKQANGRDFNAFTSFAVTPKRYGGAEGDIRLGGNTPEPQALQNFGGTVVTQGVTHLVLFKVENLLASGAATAANQTITSWILNEAQYDNFKSGGLTEGELNAASQGAGATNVMQRTTLTASQKASFSVNDFLSLQSNNTGDFMNDEFRFSDASLAEVAPLAAPAANIGAFGPGATVGPLIAGASAISWTVPFGTDVSNLVATYTNSVGSSCPRFSGTAQNFTNPVPYVITSSDSLVTNTYTVTVTVAPASSACDILTLDLPSGAGVIDQVAKTIVLTVPGSPGISSLSPTYTLSPFATCSPVSGTNLNFTSPQSYTVTAQNGITQKTYTVRAQTYQAWAYSASLFILTTPDGANIPAGATETNFPVLVRLNQYSLDFSQIKAGGADLRFATAAGVPMDYEIEQWDGVAKTAAIWVRVPTITGNARQEIKMYWGKGDAVSESSGPAVFNATNGYRCVMHMNGTVADATGSNSPVNNGATPTVAVIGSTSMNLGTGSIDASNVTNLQSGTNATSTGEVWIRARQISSGYSVPLGWGNKNNLAYGWDVWTNQIGFWGSPKALPAPLTCWGATRVAGSTALVAQQWYHVTYTSLNGVGRIYVNGMLDSTGSGGGTPNTTNPQVISLNAGGGGGDADVDEARISSVARSAAWVKMAYENQKPLQTLLGSVVQPASMLSVTPSSATINEGATSFLTAQAGGAQKVYWIEKKNGIDTVIGTDQLTLPVSTGRVSGNQNYVIQFKAIYAASVQTVDIPITVSEFIPDPLFTLTGPSTWDGRQTITLTPNISNLAALQANGVANLTYTWNVAGCAVTKTITTGTATVPGAMTLTRSQGSGPLTVTLVLNNGGTPVTVSKTITVTEPATDAWVQRTPGANEIPVNGQFYARDDSGTGKLYYQGTQSGSPAAVFLKVYTTDTGSDVLYNTYRQPLVGSTYSFIAPLAAGRVTYKVQYGTTNGGNDTVLNTVTNILCGDAYIIEGQSNALSIDNGVPIDVPSPWIRTYGNNGGWSNAVNKGGDAPIGVWGFIFAKRLLAEYNIPICIINGAIGGTRIDQHRPNPADHSLALGSDAIYANLYNRLVGAKLTHGIRALLWHQGEADQGAGGVDGGYNYKFWQQYFIDISTSWKQDFPNLSKYYVFQIWPAACGESFPTNNLLREVQRNLSLQYSNMRLMSTIGFTPPDCHYDLAGYQDFSDRISALVKQDFYGFEPSSVFTAPNLRKAYFTTAAQNEVTLVFDQELALWNPGVPNLLFLDDVGGKVASGSVTGNIMKLQLSQVSTAKKITYLKGEAGFNQANLILGKNSIAALTFADVPIELPIPSVSYASWAATSAQGLSAGVNDGPSDDPDHDGISNLLEFTLGGSPMMASTSVLPKLAVESGSWVFAYDRSDFSLGANTTQVVEYGSDLTGWTPLITIPATSAGIVTIEPGTPSDRVKVVLPSGPNRQFARLKVTR
jgi:Domain of unknown function (DUF2341)/Domain of unknown function (DUF5018)/Carbohydrate esterase, sialic acid-specific acetylesterase/Concanavalin A-like lectin/glucanases superfamily